MKKFIKYNVAKKIYVQCFPISLPTGPMKGNLFCKLIFLSKAKQTTLYSIIKYSWNVFWQKSWCYWRLTYFLWRQKCLAHLWLWHRFPHFSQIKHFSCWKQESTFKKRLKKKHWFFHDVLANHEGFINSDVILDRYTLAKLLNMDHSMMSWNLT